MALPGVSNTSEQAAVQGNPLPVDNRSSVQDQHLSSQRAIQSVMMLCDVSMCARRGL